MVDDQELDEKRTRLRQLNMEVGAQGGHEATSASEMPAAPLGDAPGMAGLRGGNRAAESGLPIPAALASELILAPLRTKAHPGEPVIPGTDFTETGVRKLLELLRTRSETPGAVARIMAGWLHAFLTRPPEDGEEVVAGANLEQLKRMTDLLGKVQTKGLVGSMGGGASPATVGTGPYAPAAPAAPAAPVVVEDMVPASFAEQRLDQMEESLNRLETALTMVVKKMHEMRQSSSPRTQPQTEEQEA